MATTLVKDTNFNMRINKQKKTSLEELYASLGMTLPEAVNVFFEKSLIEGGIPFDVRIPHYNKETEAAMQEARDMITGKAEAKSYSSAHEIKNSAAITRSTPITKLAKLNPTLAILAVSSL